MNKEEIKQWIRSKIDSSIKIPDKNFKNIFYLGYNKSYLRAKKFSKIIGNPVNKEDFKGGDVLFGVDIKTKAIWYFHIIENYLVENYSKKHHKRIKLVEEVFNEYEEYKGYNGL